MQISKVTNSPNFNGFLHLVGNNETKNDKNLAVVINTDDVSSFDGAKGAFNVGKEYSTNVHMKNGEIINIKYPLETVLDAYSNARTKGFATLYTPDDDAYSKCAQYVPRHYNKMV